MWESFFRKILIRSQFLIDFGTRPKITNRYWDFSPKITNRYWDFSPKIINIFWESQKTYRILVYFYPQNMLVILGLIWPSHFFLQKEQEEEEKLRARHQSKDKK